MKGIAGLLEEKSTIPMVRDQMVLIQNLQSDEWWQNVTTPLLEVVRRRLRLLIRLIEKHKRKPIYTNFEDDLGMATEIGLPEFAPRDQWEKFRAKVRAFLMSHQEQAAVHKLRTNQPLSAEDMV
ncbi:MAG: restriction endonuclease subunit R, partial [Planctomycetota bacterium]|nr:restriction endonuclease subunit R [Planctomycetota bacterium]